MRTAPKTALFVTAIALAVGLTGCSGGAGGQSVADACKIINEEGQAISAKASSVASTAMSDPESATEALDEVQDDFDKLDEKISNPEVKKAFGGFLTAYGEVLDIIGEAAADPEAATEAMGKLSDASTKITDAGKELDKLCR